MRWLLAVCCRQSAFGFFEPDGLEKTDIVNSYINKGRRPTAESRQPYKQ